MLVHLIQHKGRGGWVFILPLLSAFILFLIFDLLSWNDEYVGSLSLTISGMILFIMDGRGEKITVGDVIKQEVRVRERNKNTLMWIEARYWGVLMEVIGVVWLVNLASA